MTTKSPILIAALTVMFCICSGQAVEVGSPPTWASSAAGTATLKGTVKFEGRAPKPKLINMAADPSCAKQHATPASIQDIVADPKGGLQNVIVFIADGLGNRTFDAPSQPVVIHQKGCMYEPHVLPMRANQPLEVMNDDPTTHNIHPMPVNNREWNKSQPPGSIAKETFAREEIAIPVKCNVHPWMRGYVAVFKHPYFAVTSRGGSFNLNNLPPGTYTIKAWHEKLGSASQKITLGANETKAIDFVFKPHAGT